MVFSKQRGSLCLRVYIFSSLLPIIAERNAVSTATLSDERRKYVQVLYKF